MSILSDITRKERKIEIPKPDAKLFIKGIVVLLLGLTAASFYTYNDADKKPRIIISLVGVCLLTAAVVILLRYIKQALAFKKYVLNWEKHRNIFDDFAIELNKWYDSDMRPEKCDGDTAYILRLQKERLAGKGMRMLQQTAPSKKDSFGTATFARRTAWYTVDLMYENVERKLLFQNSSGTIYERESSDIMYETVVHTPNEREIARMTMTCPNCGAISPVGMLTHGCPYCATAYQIKDLFPRVTNSYFICDNASDKNTKVMWKIPGLTMIVVFLFTLVACMTDKEVMLTETILMSVGIAVFVGGIFGYLFSILVFMAKQFKRDGRKRIPFLKYVTTKGKVKRAFAPYDPYFSFEKFEGQIISLIRMAVLSDHPENLTSYCGGKLNPYFQDIVDMTYMQAITVNNIHMEGTYLCLQLRTWWINYSEHNGKINRKGDCIDVTLRRNTAYMEPPGFSITSVRCPSCGVSFDSVRQKCCPNCGTVYHMENVGFVIDRLELS